MTNRGMMFLQPLFGGFFAYGGVLRRWGNPMGDGGRCGEASAEGRLYNRSPRLACLPGVGC